MTGKSEIRFPEEIIRSETIAVLWGAVWHTVRDHTTTLKFVVPDKKICSEICPIVSDACNFMIPVGDAKTQLTTLGDKGADMLKLLTTLDCSHVICLREFSDTKPTWTAGFHQKTPDAYVYDIGSGQAQGFEAKSKLDKPSKFSYYEMSLEYIEVLKHMEANKKNNALLSFGNRRKEAAKNACTDCTTHVFRRPETMNDVAKQIAETLVRVHLADKKRPLIARGTGKHRQENIDGPMYCERLMKMIQRQAETMLQKRKEATIESRRDFRRVFSGKLLTGPEEALFGSTSVCDLLGPNVSKVKGVTTILSIESGRGSTQYGFWKKPLGQRRRMAQREFSNRRDSPVMVRLLKEIVAAQDK